MNPSRLLWVAITALSAGAWAAEAPRPLDAPVRLGRHGRVERFEDPGYPVAGFHQRLETQRAVWISGLTAFAAAPWAGQNCLKILISL
jgi:hypothetical protein